MKNKPISVAVLALSMGLLGSALATGSNVLVFATGAVNHGAFKLTWTGDIQPATPAGFCGSSNVALTGTAKNATGYWATFTNGGTLTVVSADGYTCTATFTQSSVTVNGSGCGQFQLAGQGYINTQGPCGLPSAAAPAKVLYHFNVD